MLGVLVGLAHEARIAGELGGLIAVGNGTAVGARAGATNLVQRGATALLSFGVAGGLAPGLNAGTLVVPSTVVTSRGNMTCDPAMVSRLGGPRSGPVFAASAAISGVAEKAKLLAETGAVAVDLESGAVVEAALAAHLPFAVLRVICDPASRNLPRAALVALSADGRIRIGPVLVALARQPCELPALFSLAREALVARQALRRHVRDLGCSFFH